MIAALQAAVADVAADPPRGLLVRAEGRVVSGGVDVHLFDGLSPQAAGELWTELLEMIHTVEELPLPTVFAAHALCLTAAFELSLACDLLLAAESARFGLVETVVGLTPAMGGTQRLAERAGPARARELVMTGALYDAATLERWNVVNRVLPDDGFDEAARAFARRLAEGPTRAHAATKAIVRAQVEGGVRAGRRARARAGRRPVRHRGPQGRRALLPGARPGPRHLRGPLRGLLHRRVPAARAVMIPRMPASRASRRARRSLLAGCAAVLALSASAPAADTPAPVVVKDAKDAVAGAPDLTRVQIGLASDRRVRFALTLAAAWQPKDLIAASGPPGSLCVRLWTVTKPGTTPPDYLVCATARADGETMRGTVFKTQPGEQLSKVGLAIVGRTSDRTMTLRFSQTVVGRPKTIDFIAEATKPGCTRVSCVDTTPEAPKTATFKLRGSS